MSDATTGLHMTGFRGRRGGGSQQVSRSELETAEHDVREGGEGGWAGRCGGGEKTRRFPSSPPDGRHPPPPNKSEGGGGGEKKKKRGQDAENGIRSDAARVAERGETWRECGSRCSNHRDGDGERERERERDGRASKS